jgi:hypothetical protein
MAQHQENMTAAPRSFRGQPQWRVKKLFTFIQFGWNESPTCASWSRRELRGKQKVPGKEYLTRQAYKREAEKLPYGRAREELLRKARQLETASRINEWVSSPGLSSPK